MPTCASKHARRDCPILGRDFLVACPSRLPVVEHTTFEHIASGELDTELEPSTQMANLFNHMTTVNARRWLFHHPDDNDVVPDTLPSPLEEEWQ